MGEPELYLCSSTLYFGDNFWQVLHHGSFAWKNKLDGVLKKFQQFENYLFFESLVFTSSKPSSHRAFSEW